MAELISGEVPAMNFGFYGQDRSGGRLRAKAA
jgi:D-amino-acid dehydrogenase